MSTESLKNHIECLFIWLLLSFLSIEGRWWWWWGQILPFPLGLIKIKMLHFCGRRAWGSTGPFHALRSTCTHAPKAPQNEGCGIPWSGMKDCFLVGSAWEVSASGSKSVKGRDHRTEEPSYNYKHPGACKPLSITFHKLVPTPTTYHFQIATKS